MPTSTSRLPRAFFARATLTVARDLLGQRLVHVAGGRRLAGLVIETEAYIGQNDQACHARAGRTRRTAVMYGPPGHAYVYLNYGIHWLLNVVTEREGFPAAVLIRALLPTEGLAVMRARRQRPDGELASGPGKLTQALAIDGSHHGVDLCAPDAALFFETVTQPPAAQFLAGPRVGLGKATPEPWLSRPWNFRLALPAG